MYLIFVPIRTYCINKKNIIIYLEFVKNSFLTIFTLFDVVIVPHLVGMIELE